VEVIPHFFKQFSVLW